MKHEFTDQQIIEAFEEAELAGDWEAFKRFLDALPDPEPASDDWHECTFEDIQKGDRVKWFYRDKDRENTCIGVAHRLAYANEAWVTENGAIVADISVQGQFYRIPAPVPHPDPAEHPVIIVHESTVLPKGSEPQKVMFVRPYYRNDIWNGAPDTITKWTPGEVVPKVVADDD